MEHAEAALNELVGGEVEASSKRVVEQAWFADALDGEGAELRMEMKGRAQRQWTPPMEMRRVGAVSVDPPGGNEKGGRGVGGPPRWKWKASRCVGTLCRVKWKAFRRVWTLCRTK